MTLLNSSRSLTRWAWKASCPSARTRPTDHDRELIGQSENRRLAGGQQRSLGAVRDTRQGRRLGHGAESHMRRHVQATEHIRSAYVDPYDRTTASGVTILVAEDEPLIALDMSGYLEDAGAKVIVATNLKDSLAKVDEPGIKVAIVDHRFGPDTSAAVCAKLDERGIPFIVYTGFRELPDPCKHCIIVRKPAQSQTILEILAKLLRRNVSDQG